MTNYCLVLSQIHVLVTFFVQRYRILFRKGQLLRVAVPLHNCMGLKYAKHMPVTKFTYQICDIVCSCETF